MFEELMHSIWDEFSKLVFRAEIEVEPGQGNGNGANPNRRRSTTRAAPPRPSPRRSNRSRSRAAAGPSTPPPPRRSVGNGADVVETVVKDEHDKVGRNDPCWCGIGKKYKKCHGA